MIAKKNKPTDLTELSRQLQRIRQESLEATRRNDFRTVARLTAQTASLNRQIMAGDNLDPIPSLALLSDKLFTSEGSTPGYLMEKPEEELVAA